MPDKIKILYDAVSKDYNVGSFEDFQTKLQDDVKRKAFYDGVSSEFELGDFNTFSSKVKKKDIAQPDFQFGSQTSPFGSKPSQTQVDTSVPSVLTPKYGEEYKDQKKTLSDQLQKAQKAFTSYQGEALAEEIASIPKREVSGIRLPKEKVQKEEAKGGGGTAFMADLNRFNEGLFKTPRFVYDAASTITDAALQALNLTEKESTYDEFLQASGFSSPLSVLDRVGDYYSGQANQYEKRQEKFDKDIINSLSSGNYSDAGKQLWNNIAGSIPSMVGMAVSGGAGNVAKLKYIQSTALTALPFASRRNSELMKDESIPKYVRVGNSVLNSVAEVVFDQSFGTTAMIKGIVNVFKNQGRDAAVDATNKIIKGFAEQSIKKIQPFTGALKGSVEEMSTTLSQNIVDKYTIDPERDLTQGVLDAGLVGGVMTGGVGALGSVAYSSSQKKKVAQLMKQREELVDDIDNDNLPDEVKIDLSDKLSKLDDDITNIDNVSEVLIFNLPSEDKVLLKENQDKIVSIEKALEDDSLSETAKQALTENLSNQQEKVNQILDKAAKLPVEPTTAQPTQEEPIIEPKTKEDAVQVETAGQVPVLTETTAGQEVEQGKPQPKVEGVTEEGVQEEVNRYVDLKGEIEGSAYILKNYKNSKKYPNLKIGDIVKIPIQDLMPAIGIELGNANAKPYTDAPISVKVLSDGTLRITDGHNRFKKALLNNDKEVEIKVVKSGGANVYDTWYNRMAVKAVKEGRVLAQDAKKIIEKAGLEVPKEILKEEGAKEEVGISKVKKILSAIKGDVSRLAGNSNLSKRIFIIESLTGKKVSKANAGINNLKDVVKKYVGIKPDSVRGEYDQINQWAEAKDLVKKDVGKKQGVSREVTELDILKSNLNFAEIAKKEATDYLKRYKNNPFADKVTYNKEKLADANKKIKKLNQDIGKLSEVKPAKVEEKPILYIYNGKKVISEEDSVTKEGVKYKRITFDNGNNELIKEKNYKTFEEQKEYLPSKVEQKELNEDNLDSAIELLDDIEANKKKASRASKQKKTELEEKIAKDEAELANISSEAEIVKVINDNFDKIKKDLKEQGLLNVKC